jgi:hypothetical protein
VVGCSNPELQTKFSKTACLAIIQLNILDKEQINITDEISIYDEIYLEYFVVA